LCDEQSDTILAGLYVKIDDEIGELDGWAGRPPLLGDFELPCLAVPRAGRTCPAG